MSKGKIGIRSNWSFGDHPNLMRRNRFSLIFLLLFVVVSPIMGETGKLFFGARNQSITHGTGSTIDYTGILIDSVIIDNRDIYNTDSAGFDNFVYRTTNSLHLRTKKIVIRREVLLKKGDLFEPELAEETARNIRARLQVYDAWVEVQKLESGSLLLRIVTIDEWTLSSGISVSRNGNETDYRLFLEEKNLFGYNQLLAFDYFIESTEENFSLMRFSDSRMFGHPYSLRAEYGNDPRNKIKFLSWGRPYYNLGQTWAFGGAVIQNSGRRDIYNDSLRVAESNFVGDISSLSLSYRTGQYKKKLRFNLLYRYRFEQTVSEITFPEYNGQTLPDDSAYHKPGFSIRASRIDFVKLRNIDGVGFTEDFIVGQSALIGYQRAYHPDYSYSIYDQVDIDLSHLAYSHGHLLALTAAHSYWFSSGHSIRNRSIFQLGIYNNWLSYLTVATRAQFVTDWFANGSESLVLGGESSIRGLDKFARTGNKRAIVNLEGRFFPDIRILSAVLGGVLFTDGGKVWKKGERVNFKDFIFNAGFGLRVHFERFSRDRVLRIDVSYNERVGWQLSIGTGQFFGARIGGLSLTNL